MYAPPYSWYDRHASQPSASNGQDWNKPFLLNSARREGPRKEAQSVRIIASGETHCRGASSDIKSWYVQKIPGRINSLS